jgi:hypothetical protein
MLGRKSLLNVALGRKSTVAHHLGTKRTHNSLVSHHNQNNLAHQNHGPPRKSPLEK